MNKFRRKPAIVEAMCHDCGEDVWKLARDNNFRMLGPDSPIIIPTLEGDTQCNVGDWIIKGVNGEFYPCKPDIFLKTYEPVEKGAKP